MTIPNNRSSVYVQKHKELQMIMVIEFIIIMLKLILMVKLTNMNTIKEIDRNGKIISEKGNKIPYDKINNNYENWLSNFNKQKLENNNNKIRLL